MSIGPNFIAGSVSGSQLPQARGTELDRNSDDAAQQVAKSESAKAAGLDGQLHENEQATDRDADGHTYGETSQRNHPTEDSDQESDEESVPHSLDPTGQSGNNLDLSG
jgi:hypothetical protein